MERTEKMPMWVFLALSNINRRETALWLIWGSVMFTLYSLPWVEFVPDQPWVEKLFLAPDWSWFLMMAPMTLWYWLSLRWLDKNDAWVEIEE